MKIKVVLFASARDILGEREIEVELPDTTTVGDLKQVLMSQFPQVADLVLRSAISVDHEFANDALPLQPGSEIALIPPVSGG